MSYLLVLFLLFAFSKNAFASTWYFPMDRYAERQTVKGFGQFINSHFYKGKENLFPFNRFYGYHAGVDLEAFPHEKNKKVSVYTIYSGIITYIGTLSGYGGIILQSLDNSNATALYGHVRIKELSFKVGDHIRVVSNPVVLAFLGDEFSQETSKERKHLHFAIYKGTDLYFRGHENSFSQLNARWYDPGLFLKEKNAQNPLTASPLKGSIEQTEGQVEKNKDFFYTIITWIRTLLKRE